MHDEEMLVRVARASRGSYFLVENVNAIRPCIADCISGLYRLLIFFYLVEKAKPSAQNGIKDGSKIFFATKSISRKPSCEIFIENVMTGLCSLACDDVVLMVRVLDSVQLLHELSGDQNVQRVCYLNLYVNL